METKQLSEAAQPQAPQTWGNRGFPGNQFERPAAPIAYNSRQQFTAKPLASGGAIPSVLPVFVSTFALDPGLNAYLLFAGGATVLEGAVSVPFRVDFEFFNGGSPISNTSIYWGGVTGAAQGQKSFVMSPSLDNSEIFIFDPTTNTSFSINTPSSANGGIISWTAQSDSVKISTYATVNSAALTWAANYTIGHGILSQPYNGQ